MLVLSWLGKVIFFPEVNFEEFMEAGFCTSMGIFRKLVPGLSTAENCSNLSRAAAW
jgi:hypothetical protein